LNVRGKWVTVYAPPSQPSPDLLYHIRVLLIHFDCCRGDIFGKGDSELASSVHGGGGYVTPLPKKPTGEMSPAEGNGRGKNSGRPEKKRKLESGAWVVIAFLLGRGLVAVGLIIAAMILSGQFGHKEDSVSGTANHFW
jgi:hypothetical protein